jgi:hypothetical protein
MSFTKSQIRKRERAGLAACRTPRPSQIQSIETRLLVRRHVTTLAMIVLALLAGSGVTRAQNDERLNTAANSTPKGSKQPQANSLKDEIAKMLRAYYDSWTKLDATAVNNNFTDDGFLTEDGNLISSSVLKRSCADEVRIHSGK